MKKVRTILIGHGHLGKWHAQKAEKIEMSDFVGLVDASDDTLRQVKEVYPNIQVYNSLDLVDPDSFDAAIVAAPTSFHFSICEKLLNWNKHIFCEKPVTPTHTEALSLLEKWDQKTVFQIGHSERFHEFWSREDLYKEFLSKDYFIVASRQAPFLGRATDVDVVQDLMIHDLDLIWKLTDQAEIKSCSTKGLSVRTSFKDQVIAELSFGKNRSALIRSGRNYPEVERYLDISSPLGCARFDLLKETLKIQRNQGAEIEEHKFEKRDHLYEQQKIFYESILNQTTPSVSLNEAVNIMEWVDLVRKSLGGS